MATTPHSHSFKRITKGESLKEFISLDECALYNDTSRLALQKLRSKDKAIERTDRFQDGKVLMNYKNPLEFELSELYYKAVFVAGTEYELAKEIAPMLKMKASSVYSYLHRFNFKHFKKSYRLRDVLQSYCDTSLWSIKDETGQIVFVAEY